MFCCYIVGTLEGKDALGVLMHDTRPRFRIALAFGVIPGMNTEHLDGRDRRLD